MDSRRTPKALAQVGSIVGREADNRNHYPGGI